MNSIRLMNNVPPTKQLNIDRLKRGNLRNEHNIGPSLVNNVNARSMYGSCQDVMHFKMHH
ncbi:hypothetical protein BLOT_004046 [Blomia tropicalis]|nr:hypothetical protein BLOT_004046 [Blomia tropicalis]